MFPTTLILTILCVTLLHLAFLYLKATVRDVKPKEGNLSAHLAPTTIIHQIILYLYIYSPNKFFITDPRCWPFILANFRMAATILFIHLRLLFLLFYSGNTIVLFM